MAYYLSLCFFAIPLTIAWSFKICLRSSYDRLCVVYCHNQSSIIKSKSCCLLSHICTSTLAEIRILIVCVSFLLVGAATMWFYNLNARRFVSPIRKYSVANFPHFFLFYSHFDLDFYVQYYSQPCFITPQISLCRSMLVLNPGLLGLRHWCSQTLCRSHSHI
jgi:hypothetical protein